MVMEKQPEVIRIRGKKYRLTLFRISNLDEDGRPEECVMIPDERAVEIASEKELFMVCYVPLDQHPLPEKQDGGE